MGHRWTSIANMAAWRRSAGSSLVSNFQTEGGSAIAFCRGSAACVALNRQSDAWDANVKFDLPAGSYCNVIVSDDPSSCPKVTVSSDGSANFQVPAIGAVALHRGKMAMDVLV